MTMRLTENTFGPLAPHLLDFAHAMQARELPLTLVGGFGLLLRRQWRVHQEVRTLIANIPQARATDDFDVLLRLEVLLDASLRKAIREVLSSQGYEAHAANFQFIKPYSSSAGRKPVRIDFLAPKESIPGIKISRMRIGPEKSTPNNSLHGYATPEAILVDEAPLVVLIEGTGSDGQEKAAQVRLPHPYTLSMAGQK